MLNDAFCADGLTPPLSSDSDLPTTLDEFSHTRPPRPIDGPLISIVVPAHNAASTLQIAVVSLIEQTWRNVELIIVDDRSTDATAAIAASLASRETRIRVLSNARTPGAYGARNTGIEAARGEFVALHDADDWAHPQRLERQMRRLGDDKGVAICRYFRLDTNGRPVCPRVFPFVRLSPIAITTRAKMWSAVGPFEEVAVGADSEWLARADERFGRRSNPRMSEVGMVALWEGRSLSAAPQTGFLGEGLLRRTAYVETWRRRHAYGRPS
jgi:glycosyltransferase involved in cell wall biosynthesis